MSVFTDEHGNPFLPLGLQVSNSSTGDPEMMDREMAALKLFRGNVLEAPVYWFRCEAEEGVFDFSDLDDLVRRCREAGVYLIPLWFGFNKNGHPNYVPEWVKLHPEIYRPAKGPDGADVASLSPLCEATREADCRAFTAFMEHVAGLNRERRTIIAVQVENEIGLANTDMDYGAPELYRQPVPAVLDGIVPEDAGVEPSGNTWKSRFGRHAHEVFSAWASAVYVERLAAAGKAVCPLPMLSTLCSGRTGLKRPESATTAARPWEECWTSIRPRRLPWTCFARICTSLRGNRTAAFWAGTPGRTTICSSRNPPRRGLPTP